MASPLLESSNSLYNFVVRDGNGVKGLLESGISQVPERYIQPPRERIHDIVSTPQLNLPPIDLSKLHGPEHDRVTDDIARAAESLGFFQVVNHGVPLELLEQLKLAAHRFFCMSPEQKKAVGQRNVKYGTSFAPEKEKALEWKDYVSMGYTNDEDALQYWPDLCKYACTYLLLSTHTHTPHFLSS